MTSNDTTPQPVAVRFSDLLRVFTRVGFLIFG